MAEQQEADRWSEDYLDSKRTVADPAADAVIEALFAEAPDRDMATRRLLNMLIENDNPVPQDLPEFARAFIEQTMVLPTWADARKLRSASKVFALYGPEIVWVLFCRSLPMCYACANGAEVLASTGRLNHPEWDDDRVLNRRVMETAQFVMDVMAPGAFESKGRAIVATRKIRLIHASIRHFLRFQVWDVDRYGEPINQEDMAGTLLSFSITVTQGLKLMHVPLTDAQEEAFVHLWKVVGHLIGLDEDLQPQDVDDAIRLEQAILSHQMAYSKAGEDLTASMINYLKHMLGARFMRRFPAVLIRFMVGDEIADTLRVRHRRAHWPFYVFMLVVRWLSRKQVRSKWVRSFFKRFNVILLQSMIDAQNPVKGVHFRIPPGLRTDWGVES